MIQILKYMYINNHGNSRKGTRGSNGGNIYISVSRVCSRAEIGSTVADSAIEVSKTLRMRQEANQPASSQECTSLFSL